MIERDGNQLRVSGPLTIETVTAVCEAGRREFSGGGVVIVDLAATVEVDSSALSLLFEWQREASRHGTRISVRNLPASLQSLAALYGVSELIPANT